MITFDNLAFTQHPATGYMTYAVIKVNGIEVSAINGVLANCNKNTYEVMVGDSQPLCDQTPEDITEILRQLQTKVYL